MSTWRVNNATALGGEVCAPWQPNHAYALGARCVCRVAYGTAAARGYVFECTTAGNSHASTEPTWPTSGTVADGPDTLVWTARSPNDGLWDNASCILHYVLNHGAGIAAGDLVLVHEAHNETAYSNDNYIVEGSLIAGNPIKIICVDKADDSLSTGAAVAAGLYYPLWLRNYLFTYGICFKPGGYAAVSVRNHATYGGEIVLHGGGTAVLDLTPDSATFAMLQTGYIGSRLLIVAGNIIFKAAAFVLPTAVNFKFHWKGGKLQAGSGASAITHLFDGWGEDRIAKIEDVDLDDMAGGATASDLLDATETRNFDILFARCKLPADEGFAITRGTWPVNGNGRIRLHHCSSGDRYYDFHEECAEGKIEDETTVVRTGGASDGTIPQAWKLTSSALVKDNFVALESPPIAAWNSFAVEKTFTVECLVDSATNLQNDEVWMELEYPVDNSSGLGAVARDKCAILGAPADKSAGVGSGNWTTTGLTNPNSFKCAVTVTPGKAGPVTARICLAKASTTIYVDPKITVS